MHLGNTTTATMMMLTLIAGSSSRRWNVVIAASSPSCIDGCFSSPSSCRLFSMGRRRMTPDNTSSVDINGKVVADESSPTDENADRPRSYIPPWSIPLTKSKTSTSYARFRQHVNPLARKYQMETQLPPNWPNCNYNDLSLPLFVDIGCGKGGFLLDLAGKHRGISRNYGDGLFNDDVDDDEDKEETIDSSSSNKEINIIQHPTISSTTTTKLWPLPSTMNYLGLEIRPGVSQYAQSRVSKHGLDGCVSYVGCNANIDLDRLLTLYANNSVGSSICNDNNSNNNNHGKIRPMITFASIQFPDPHFKIRHAKRRIVTTELVSTLAKFVMTDGGVFLQSDVKEALEAMREKFVEGDVDDGPGKKYFDEWSFDTNDEKVGVDEGEEREYGMENPLGVPTEREGSVLVRGLPVYRTLFKRNSIAF